MEHWEAIAQQRHLLAGQLEVLTHDQWIVPSLCGEWTVKEVAAHLVVPYRISTLAFVAEMARNRGNFDRANARLASREARRPVGDIVADLRAFADGRFTPPGFGSEAPLTDVLIHAQDIRIPLGLETLGPVEPWRVALDLMMTRRARRGFVSREIPAVRLVATDIDWSHGTGDEVRGPAPALALTIAGRSALAAELEGEGAARFIDSMTT